MRSIALLLVVVALSCSASGQSTWTQVFPQNNSTGGFCAAMVYDSDRDVIVRYGGHAFLGNVVAGTWEYDGSTWTEISTVNSPGPRTCTSMVYDDARNVVVLYGGWVPDTHVQVGGTWEYDGVDWTEVVTASSPGPRFTTLVYDSTRARVVAIGGRFSGVNISDTWEYDGNDWTQTVPNGSFSNAHDPAACYDPVRKRIWTYGGSTNGLSTSNRLWSYDPEAASWFVFPIVEPNPGFRRGAATTWHASRGVMVMYAGLQGDPTPDTWEFDPSTMTWTEITSTPSPGVERPGAAYDSRRARTVAWGGSTPQLGDIGVFATTWEYGSSIPVVTSCDGDGGDQMGCTDCPCNNNAPAGSEGGCLNSAGTSTRLLLVGSDSVTAGDLRAVASGASADNACILTSGNALAPANAANPCFGLDSGIQSVSLDGLRCVVAGVLRHGIRRSDENGDIGTTNEGWGTPDGFFQFSAFVSGVTKHFQIIHRDDAALVCGTGLNTSQASSVVFTP